MSPEPESNQEIPVFKNLWAKESAANEVARPFCTCLNSQYHNGPPWMELQIHTEEQDEDCAAWQRLNELIDQAAEDGRETFSPVREMDPNEWAQITALPKSIAKLKAVKHLILYGSSLVRIPPEIEGMTSLEEFTPYTSYRLHWFPYEIRYCKKLKNSTISTRALYGNFRYRPPFPQLPQTHPGIPDRCSVCRAPFDGQVPLQYWISLPIGTDVVPLLVHACSKDCIEQLPVPVGDYVKHLHQGGLGLAQPSTEF